MTLALTPEESVWKTVADRLRTVPNVKKVYEGYRQGYIDGVMPCIVMEILPSREVKGPGPKMLEVPMIIEIRGVIGIKNRLDDQIIGDDRSPGILRFERAIKLAFEGNDLKLNNRIHGYEIETMDNKNVNDNVREVVIRLTLQLNYQVAGQRT